jgi:hypothetical protein
VPKKLLQMAGIQDCWTAAKGCTATLGNFGLLFSGVFVLNRLIFLFSS